MNCTESQYFYKFPTTKPYNSLHYTNSDHTVTTYDYNIKSDRNVT